MSEVRKQILAQIVQVIHDAEVEGQNSTEVAKLKFPDVPETVIYEAWSTWEFERTEAWWKTMEKTIDEAVIVKALGRAQ